MSTIESKSTAHSAPLVRYLFTPASSRREAGSPERWHRRLEAGDLVAFFLYALILAWGIHQHVPWADESQAWLTARDSSLREILFRRLHYEGAAPLWPLMLWCITRLHVPYAGLNWFGGIFALGGVGLLLARSPFPRVIRWLLPFTFYLQYQYAVIARPYVFFPALLFGLCSVFCLARPRPLLFAVIAGLLANVGLHAAILSCVFTLLYLRSLWSSSHRRSLQPRQLILALVVLLSLAFFSLVVAFPAPDVTIAGGTNQSFKHPSPVLLRLIPPERLPEGAPPLDSAHPANSAKRPDTSETFPEKILSRVLMTFVTSLQLACFAISTSSLLALVFLVTFCLWLWSRASLALILPYCIGLALSVQIFVHNHHAGMFLLGLVAAAWIALERPPVRRVPATIQPLVCVTSALILVLQIGWSAYSIVHESHTRYDPGRETERFLAGHYPGKRIAGFAYESVSTNAWAQKNLFFNQPDAFWHWSAPVFIDRRENEALQQHPDVVVVGDLTTGQQYFRNQFATAVRPNFKPYAALLSFWLANGYHETHRFCGERPARMGLSDSFCEIILEPDAISSTRP